LWAEIQKEQDLYLLDCTENMKGGKSFDYFASLQHDFPGFHYYSEADTDTYILFHNLAMALYMAPRCAFYAGGCNDPDPAKGLPTFVFGFFYTLSRDLLPVLEAYAPKCGVMNRGAEDVTPHRYLKCIRYGDFGSQHDSILYDRQPLNMTIEPLTVLLHLLKAPHERWRVHQEVLTSVTVDATLFSSRRLFVDMMGEILALATLYGDAGKRLRLRSTIVDCGCLRNGEEAKGEMVACSRCYMLYRITILRIIKSCWTGPPERYQSVKVKNGIPKET